MIASIVPLKRLPRYSSIFDYAIPHDLEQTIQPGQLVIIEFRKKKEYGMVLHVSKKENSEYTYKPIDVIVHATPLVSKKHQELLLRISNLYAVSIGTVYKTSALPLQKRKLKKLELISELNLSVTDSIFSEASFLYENESEHALLFSKLVDFHTTLILVPELSRLDETYQHIQRATSAHVIIWRSDLSIKEKFDLWLQIRNNVLPLIIIGTRSALTLPFMRLDCIIMDFEHDPQYKSYDQQPKFHTRDIVKILGRIYQSTCIYASFSPSFELYYSIMKEKLPCVTGDVPYSSGLLFQTQNFSRSIRIIEHSPRTREDQVCSIAIEDSILAIAKENTHDAILLVQRKGYATMVICKDCGHLETATESGLPMMYREETRLMHAPYDGETRPLPLSCKTCGSTKLQLQGMGTEKVASHFSKLFKKEHTEMPVFRIDDNTDTAVFGKLSSDTPRLLVGTEKALPYIRHDKTRIYAILDLDRYLAMPEYNSFEHMVHLIDGLNYGRSTDSELLLETVSADKNLFKLFSERDRVYRTELSIRQKLGYPPYQSMIKYTLSSFHQGTARILATQFRRDLAVGLTEANIPATLSEIYETHPNFDKGKHWYGVLLKTDQKNIPKIAEVIHATLPRECVVDLNPLSVLSP